MLSQIHFNQWVFMQLNKKFILVAAISAAFICPLAPANAAGLLSAPAAQVAYSENTLSTQTILAQLSYLSSAQVNGYMDTATRGAIASFQQDNGLKTDGLIDPLTAQLLNTKYSGQLSNTNPSYAPSLATPSLQVLGNIPYSSDVFAIQQILYKLGFLKSEADGHMDTNTRLAIAEFQTVNNLPSTGDVDQATADLMNTRFSEQSTEGSSQANWGDWEEFRVKWLN